MKYKNEFVKHIGNDNRPIPQENEKRLWTINEIYEAERANLWGIERGNRGIEFDGVNDYIEKTTPSPSDLEDTKKLTVACWLQKHSSGTLKQIFHFAKDDGTTIAEMYYWTSDSIFLELYNSSSAIIGSIFFSSDAWTASEWHHVAVSVNLEDQVASVIVDGSDVSSNWTGLINDNIAFSTADRLVIGAFWNGTSHTDFMDGQIAQLYINTKQFVDLTVPEFNAVVLD